MSWDDAGQAGLGVFAVREEVLRRLDFAVEDLAGGALGQFADEPDMARVLVCRHLGGDHRLPHHAEDDLAGHEFAAVEMPLNGQAGCGPPD